MKKHGRLVAHYNVSSSLLYLILLNCTFKTLKIALVMFFLVLSQFFEVFVVFNKKGAGALAQQVKLLPAMVAFHTSTVQVPAAPFQSSSMPMAWEGHQKMVQGYVSLPISKGDWMTFPGSWIQPGPDLAIWAMNQWMKISPSLCHCALRINK